MSVCLPSIRVLRFGFGDLCERYSTARRLRKHRCQRLAACSDLNCRCKIRNSDNQFHSLSILLGYMSGIRPMGEAGAALWACVTGSGAGDQARRHVRSDPHQAQTVRLAVAGLRPVRQDLCRWIRAHAALSQISRRARAVFPAVAGVPAQPLHGVQRRLIAASDAPTIPCVARPAKRAGWGNSLGQKYSTLPKFNGACVAKLGRDAARMRRRRQ